MPKRQVAWAVRLCPPVAESVHLQRVWAEAAAVAAAAEADLAARLAPLEAASATLGSLEVADSPAAEPAAAWAEAAAVSELVRAAAPAELAEAGAAPTTLPHVGHRLRNRVRRARRARSRAASRRAARSRAMESRQAQVSRALVGPDLVRIQGRAAADRHARLRRLNSGSGSGRTGRCIDRTRYGRAVIALRAVAAGGVVDE